MVGDWPEVHCTETRAFDGLILATEIPTRAWTIELTARSDYKLAGFVAGAVVTLETLPTVLVLTAVWNLLGLPLLIWFAGCVAGVIPFVKVTEGWLHPERKPNASSEPWRTALLVALFSTVLTILSWSSAFPGT